MNTKQKLNKSGSKQIRFVLDEINKKEHDRSFKFSENKNRRLKKFCVYKLIREDGLVKKRYLNVNVTGFKKRFEIGKYNKVVGFTPDYVGFRPSKPVFCHNYIKEAILIDYHSNKQDNELYNEILNCLTEPKDVWNGSYDSNSGHLLEFLRDKVDIDGGLTTEDILRICNGNPWFKVPHLEFNDPTEMYTQVNFNPHSSPGHYTSKITKQIKKKYTVDIAYALALEEYEKIKRGPHKNYSLWDILAREKEIKIMSDKDPSTRVVMNPEHHVTMLLSWFFQKFMKASIFGNDKVNYLIEKEYDGTKAKKLYDRIITKYDYIVDADWSWFDSSESSEMLKAAICIMFSKMNPGKKNTRLVYWILETTITKYLAIPPGIVVELNSGMPSGHPGVTAINCIINLIRWSIIGYEIYGEDYHNQMEISVYGDDALVGFKYHERLFKIDEIKEKYKWKGDSLADRLFPSVFFNLEPHNTPDFLKRRFNLFGVYWNRSKILDRMLNQTKKRDINDQIELIINYIITGPFDYEMNQYLLIIIKNIKDKYKHLISEEIMNKIDNFKIDFNRFNLLFPRNYLEGMFWEESVLCNREWIFIPNLKDSDSINFMENHFTTSDKDLVKILIRFNGNGEVLRKYYSKRKVLIINPILNKYFYKVRGGYRPKVISFLLDKLVIHDSS